MSDGRNDGRDLKYPIVHLFTGGAVMPMMYANIMASWDPLLFNSPWLFMQAWMSALNNQSGQKDQRPTTKNVRACNCANTGRGRMF
jgi:hypothetical protein